MADVSLKRDDVSVHHEAEDPDDLREALRWLRERIGLSRDELARESGVSAVHIKFIERGKRNPSETVVERLLPALRVSRADLDGLLRLRPWSVVTAAGVPATLSAYAAGVPLHVDEGDEFAGPTTTAVAAAQGPPATAAQAPAAPATAQAPAPAAARAPTRPAPRRAARLGDEAEFTAAGGPPAPPATPPVYGAASASPPGTLEAELIELRERYVHLPRSKQEMVIGWLRALDDR